MVYIVGLIVQIVYIVGLIVQIVYIVGTDSTDCLYFWD